jgi:hypothetical protein
MQLFFSPEDTEWEGGTFIYIKHLSIVACIIFNGSYYLIVFRNSAVRFWIRSHSLKTPLIGLNMRRYLQTVDGLHRGVP